MENCCVNCVCVKVDGYDYCESCIKTNSKICTCNKIFTESPTVLKIYDKEYEITDNFVIPRACFIQLRGNIYHILGCRGCKLTDDEIKNSKEKSIQANIFSCVYQYYDSDYHYMSDSLDPVFEEQLIKNKIYIGEPLGIKLEYSDKITQ